MESSHLLYRREPAKLERIDKLAINAFSSHGTSLAAATAAPPAIEPPSPLLGDILSSLDEAKAQDVVSIDIRGKTAIADAMVIATGRSNVHVGAIADRVIKACKAFGVGAPKVEGLPQCDWVLVDVGDVIVHIFRPETRQFYNLEKMWGGDRPRELRLA
ncbi:MAG TPA: ribosome silencing factor [Methylocystis sp.]|nr:ribosome silencing factor [Methylocystis sp.]